MRRFDGSGANAVGAVIAIPFSFLASFAFDRSHPLPTKMEQIFPIFYLAIASSVVAFGLFAWLVNHWRVSTVSFLGVIVPVMAVGLGVVFRQESIAPGALLGAVVVIASVAVAVRFQIASSPAA